MSSVVHIEEITPGMVLGSPILNRYGQTLIAAGVVIEEKHLLMFKTWGIKHITVEGVKKQEQEVEISEDLLNLARNHVKKRMLFEPSLPIEEDLYSATVERIIDIYPTSELESNND